MLLRQLNPPYHHLNPVESSPQKSKGACVVEAAQSSQSSLKRVESSPQKAEDTFSSTVSDFFRVLGAWAAGEKQLVDIDSALPQPCADWPEEIRLLWKQIGFADAQRLAGDTIQRYSVPILLSGWISSLDERHQRILSARTLAIDKPRTLDDLGESYCVTRERVRQIEQKAKKRLAEFRSAEYAPVLRRARRLRDRLGIALPSNDQSLIEAMTWVVADFGQSDLRKLAQQVFLWLSGPYRNHNGWLPQTQPSSRGAGAPFSVSNSACAHFRERNPHKHSTTWTFVRNITKHGLISFLSSNL